MFPSNFPITAGVRQEDPLSSTLFSIFTNDLFVREDNVNDENSGHIDISCLLFADNIVLIANSETGQQSLLNKAY